MNVSPKLETIVDPILFFSGFLQQELGKNSDGIKRLASNNETQCTYSNSIAVV